MDMLIITLGSSGDVNPFAGLAVTLKRRGHKVTFVTNPCFRGIVEQAGLEFCPLGTAEEYMAALSNPDLWHPHKALRFVIESLILRSMREAYGIVREQCRPGTVLVTSSLMAGARIAAEDLRYPLVTVDLQPSAILSAHSLPVSSSFNLPKWSPLFIRKLFLQAVERAVIDPIIAPGINAFRAELGYPPVRDVFSKWLHSPEKTVALFPEWFASPQPDWPPNTHQAGFILYDAGERVLPPEASGFLDAGEPPIVFTPGTAMQHGEAFFRAAAGAARVLGRRALFLTRHSGHLPSPLPDGCAHFEYLPFSLVFPRAAAVVHHGGIGTTAQALAAGVPQLVMPTAHDQPDNAARLLRLGVASVLAPKEFTGERVARTLGEMLASETIRERCREYARKIDSAKSAERACEEIEKTQ